MKKFMLFMLILFCLLPLTVFAADSPKLPDLTAFAGTLLTDSKVEDFGFCKRVTLYGSSENVKKVADAYLELLYTDYSIAKHAHFTTGNRGQEMLRYVLGYTGPLEVGTVGYLNEDEGWQITHANVILYCTQYSKDNFIQLTYRSKFNYLDNGDRAAGATVTAAPLPTATPRAIVQVTAKPTATTHTNTSRSCSSCGGDGWRESSCSSCGGDGRTERRCSSCFGDGKRDCMSCAGKGYDNCNGCYGSGNRRCGACNGTGSNGSKRCSTCYGSGKRACSSCSGSGRKRCSACSGSGDRSCTYCGGDGNTTSSCSSCGGDGRRESLCSTCGGSGKTN